MSAIEKLEKRFRELTGQRLRNTSPIKLHSLLKDIVEDTNFINIFRCYVVSETNFDNERLYEEHEVTETDWLDNISYEYYETTSLWWLIAMTNNIVNPFEYPEAGDSLKILKYKYVYKLLKEIEFVGEL